MLAKDEFFYYLDIHKKVKKKYVLGVKMNDYKAYLFYKLYVFLSGQIQKSSLGFTSQ